MKKPSQREGFFYKMNSSVISKTNATIETTNSCFADFSLLFIGFWLF